MTYYSGRTGEHRHQATAERFTMPCHAVPADTISPPQDVGIFPQSGKSLTPMCSLPKVDTLPQTNAGQSHTMCDTVPSSSRQYLQRGKLPTSILNMCLLKQCPVRILMKMILMEVPIFGLEYSISTLFNVPDGLPAHILMCVSTRELDHLIWCTRALRHMFEIPNIGFGQQNAVRALDLAGTSACKLPLFLPEIYLLLASKLYPLHNIEPSLPTTVEWPDNPWKEFTYL